MYIGNFLQGLTDSERKKLKVDELLSFDFLFGNQTTTKITTYQYESMPIDVHLVIKHRNMGKIESHLWFFKGFCNTLNPEITTILDAGTIPMWKSISHMTMYMELYKDVGAV